MSVLLNAKSVFFMIRLLLKPRILHRATENSKNNLWAKFPLQGQSQKKMSVLLNAKSVFFMIRFVVEA